MPVVLVSIDKIARTKTRDVLFLRFEGGKESLARQNVIDWLDASGISYELCYGFWRNNLITEPYDGTIYLDVAPNDTNPLYRKLLSHFENEDGTMRISGVVLQLLPLRAAVKNAHHDTPGHVSDP